ncbi:serine carboxypeptidase [Venturia nashicola]|uniref:Carboxypeptidase n=1 Tax=Venturia nashicola TaxID=86259 RepID=A0A4Z1NSC2_9PEZI|nr:serine carboxypeptidase [Venturia nashicola]TLD19022.1 serine carboxypeptidase [Venturia nashicola]
MLWIEQPVGVGFTQGVPNITNEVELGLQFIGFYKNFVDTFDVHKYKVYLTGESYAGYYIPYIADAFITANNTDYYNLKGTWVNSPLLGDQNIQRQVGLVPFANYWNKLLYYNETFLSKMNERAISCNYIAYMDKYLTFPPPQEKFPVLPAPSASNNYHCDVFFNLRNAAYDVNPCFNYYRISELCPHPYSVIRPTAYNYSPPGMRIYFNRSDVQSAINAPPTNWVACTDVNVFANQPVRNTSDSGSDQSLGPAQNEVLRRVIEFNNNTMIGSGDLDMILATNTTLLTVQNVTWNGLQGFQSYPGQPLYVPPHPEYNDGALAAFGIQGSWGRERGLTFFRVQLGGHELPGWAPGVAYRALELLLGRVKSLDESAGPFTTLPGNFTGTSPIYKRAAGDFMRDRRRRVEL